MSTASTQTRRGAPTWPAYGRRHAGFTEKLGATRSLLFLALVLASRVAIAQEPPPEGSEPPPAASTEPSAAPGSAEPEAKEDEAKKAEAAEHFLKAKAFYQDGKYVDALQEFKQAEALHSSAALWFNIARCHEKLSQWKEAIDAYEKFAEATDNPTERTEALDRIQYLRTRLGPDEGSPEDRYRALTDSGKKAYSRGDYEAAIADFKAAYEAKASPGALFNIGKSYERMSRYEEAIEYLQQYLDLSPNAPDRSDVEEMVKRLRKSIRERFQELSVSSTPPGAEIYLDDRNTGLQGQTNFRFKVTPGPHTIYLDLNGYEPVKREFVMPDDKPLALDFNLNKMQNVGHVTVKVNKDGARIFIDGAIVGLSPYKQQKTLPIGPHQLSIEAQGFPRYTRDFTVAKDKVSALDVVLEEYTPPVSDDTLEKWGWNLVLIGVIGGGLGFGGAFAYEKLMLRRDLFDEVGPETPSWGQGVTAEQATYWRGPGQEGGRENSELNTLKGVQLWSIVGGSVFVAGGLAFFCYKWFRSEDKVEIVADAALPTARPIAEVRSIGFIPTEHGGMLGLSGSF